MAFNLRDGNLTSADALGSQTGGATKATAANFIDIYEYNMTVSPQLDKELYNRYGSGRLLPFLSLIGATGDFSSDQVRWAERTRSRKVLIGLTVAGNVFTCPSGTTHNLRVGEIVIVSDGTINRQARVSSVTSETVFEALNFEAGAFGLTGTVDVFKFSNSFAKGTGNFTESLEWSPDFYVAQPQIIKEFYDVPESEMAHLSWINTASGPMWYNFNYDQTLVEYKNLLEFTHIFGKRAEDTSAVATNGAPKGMNGLVPQIEKRGNIANEMIEDVEQLSGISYRIKQQGTCRAYTIHSNHAQLAKFRQALAGVNAKYNGGTDYGIFGNEQTALDLNFNSVAIDGVTYHITPLELLDDPSGFGKGKIKETGISSLIIPAGEKMITQEGGSESSTPYLQMLYRGSSDIDRRYMDTDFFGGKIGTPHKKDTMEMHIKSETTSKVVGANEYFVVRGATGYYS